MLSRRTGFLSCLSLIALASCNPQGSNRVPSGGEEVKDLERDRGAVMGAESPDLTRFKLKIVSVWIDHGDATLLFLPSGEIALVDTGQTWATKELLLPFLKAHGIWQLDYLIITHYHGDHVGGLVNNGGEVSVGDPGDPNVTRVPARHFYDYQSFHAGQRLRLGGANLLVLNSAHENQDAGENEKSLSFKLEVGGFVFTLGADIYAEQQERILREYPNDMRAHVYRTNHHLHGSVSREYLIRTDPFLFVTSAQDAVYQREAFTVDFKYAVDQLKSHGGRLIESLLTLERGNVVIWANSDRDWGYGTYQPGTVIPKLAATATAAPSPDTGDPSAYRPRCSQSGLESPGVFRVDYLAAEPGWGWMKLTWGRGFSCRRDPSTSSADPYPTCQAACPEVTQSYQDGWGFCEGSQGFSCRVQ